jgi:hypothetical protein
LSAPSTRHTRAPMIDAVFAINGSPLSDSVLAYSAEVPTVQAVQVVSENSDDLN